MMIAFANATSDDDTEGDIINTYLLDERLRGWEDERMRDKLRINAVTGTNE